MMESDIKEIERLKVVKRYEILDTPPDGSFDRITALASKIFSMPIALITLVDHDRIWFKSSYGLDEVEQIDRDPGLCASAILSKDVYLVENAIEDPRCLANPLVCGEFGLRFYAAAPLQTRDGYNLGNLCIIDHNQRYINSEQKEILQELAAIVVDEMELRLAARIAIRKSNERIAELEKQLKQ
ncbi:GAF domain-containing protein [Adhaeribacter aquaticus]|uniref:GAF domain-containing protein n=1 Tax=Adhaeribacter aquaticus TaxID=299567 RepID=UPI001FDF8EEA|nr:GAF domain-containing protein [Adhaeribacter aquaticus]